VRLVFGAILGTGAGGGIVVDGHIIGGANGIAGEWGHNPLPWMTPQEFPGPRCYCGRSGCIERFVSGPALAADHERATGAQLAPEEIAARAGCAVPRTSGMQCPASSRAAPASPWARSADGARRRK
jgi:fructokinase